MNMIGLLFASSSYHFGQPDVIVFNDRANVLLCLLVAAQQAYGRVAESDPKMWSFLSTMLHSHCNPR